MIFAHCAPCLSLIRSNDVPASRLTLGGPFKFFFYWVLLRSNFKCIEQTKKKILYCHFDTISAHIVGQIGGWHRIRLQHSPRRAAPIYARIRPSHQRMGSRTFRVSSFLLSLFYSYHAQFQDTFQGRT